MYYTQTQALIKREGERTGQEPKFLFVTGPGHGAPAILSQLWAEGAITKFYQEYNQTKEGLEKFVKAFSWPGGFPSHINAETPGSIHEGGELGYALAVAYGSVFDSPDLVSVVVIGDGESETGPTAAAWHSHKWLDPKESGAVLPILHVNGFKISERTIPGTMDATELALLYSGYGYSVRIVDYESDGPETVHMGGGDAADRRFAVKMAAYMDDAYAEIRAIQKDAREGKPREKPRFPLLIVRTPKGWTGPIADHGSQLLNSFRSHQVPLPKANSDPEALEHLENWLKSYEPEQFFDLESKGSCLKPEVVACLPKQEDRKLGFAQDAYNVHHELKLSDWKQFGYEKDKGDVSCMQAIGKYLADAVEQNPTTLRIFSPDELASNKLDGVFDAPTHRNFQPDPETAHDGGRVTEMLSEHTLQGWLQGYTLTGRTGIFPSYEAFLGIVATMLVQYSKFQKMALESTWRKRISSLNYIETSTWTRQEHNGYSHQSPSFISTVLQLPTNIARVYFPSDANTSASVIAHCLASKSYVNLIVGTKAPSRLFLTVDEAEKHCVAGASIWESYSVDKGLDPDVVLVGIGFELTEEIICAAELLKKEFGSDLRVRVVNVVDLLIFAPEGDHPHALDQAGFESLFPPGVPVVINYHGYVSQLMGLLYNRPHAVGRARFSISGYSEQGSTTTPWMMLQLNECDRYSLAERAVKMVVDNFSNQNNVKGDERRYRVGKVVAKAHQTISWFQHTSKKMQQYAYETQEDAPEIGQVGTLTEG